MRKFQPTVHTPLLALVVIAVAVPSPLDAKTGEWRAYAADHAASKYSPLDQITADNVKELEIVWRQSAIPDATRHGNDMRAPSYHQNTPLMAGGLLYISTGMGIVAALDPTTGDVVWADIPPGREGKRTGAGARGVAYWTDGRDARIIAVIGSTLVALDATTGERVLGFGETGEVDLTRGFDTRDEVASFGWRSAPIIANDVIIIGSQIDDINFATKPAGLEGAPGDVRGFDVQTGEQLWIFHTVPQENEPGVETWLVDPEADQASWEYTGNANMWAAAAADEELGYVYLPLSTPTNDYYGGHRPGDNLFAESLVCLEARTGRLVWYFQAVHHGLWDYDFPAPPNLVDITVDGRAIKAVAIVSKQAFTYVFDRITGEPVWPIEERRVPPGDVPGEWYAATQPFPTKPPPFDRQGVTLDDLINFTPELRAEALAIVEDYVIGPMFTAPSLVDGRPGGTRGTIQHPGTVGGANWTGAGVDPETGVLYVPSIHSTNIIGIVRSEHPRAEMRWVRKEYTYAMGPQGLPLLKPPYGRLTALDLNTGTILWQKPNGEGPRDHPALRGLDLPWLGQAGRAAPLVTKTLLFAGEGINGQFGTTPPNSGGKKFRAYDKRTGDIVAELDLDGGTTSAPMSYMAGGRQYIVVAIGWDDRPAEYIALALAG